MKNVTVSLDPETYRRARIRAAEAGRSLSSLVREAIEEIGSGESEFDRLRRDEMALRERLLRDPSGLRASDRLSREELHERASARAETRRGRA